MSQTNNALNLFQKEYACSQAVISQFCEPLGLDQQTALRLAGGFAAGMRQGETCGAVTAAYMILGLKFCGDDSHTPLGRKKVNDAVVKFTSQFTVHHGSVSCKELLGCNIGTPEGMTQAKEQKLFVDRCPLFVQTTSEILDTMLMEDDQK